MSHFFIIKSNSLISLSGSSGHNSKGFEGELLLCPYSMLDPSPLCAHQQFTKGHGLLMKKMGWMDAPYLNKWKFGLSIVIACFTQHSPSLNWNIHGLSSKRIPFVHHVPLYSQYWQLTGNLGFFYCESLFKYFNHFSICVCLLWNKGSLYTFRVLVLYLLHVINIHLLLILTFKVMSITCLTFLNVFLFYTLNVDVIIFVINIHFSPIFKVFFIIIVV